MKTKRSCLWVLALLLLALCLAVPVGYTLVTRHNFPLPARHELAEGVIYRRIVRYQPRALVAHIVLVDIKASRARFLVTPPDDTKGENPLRARTTSQFVQDFGVDIAINGGGFTPWYANSALDYYPHPGDPVTPIGLTASKGKVYSDGPGPTLYINANNRVTFNTETGKLQNALSGDRMLVQDGQALAGLDTVTRAPRTAVGLDRKGETLILVVADGRQPFYSQGMTFAELAALLVSYGAETALALDGGGSSTLVVDGKLLNSPIDGGIPGRERAVANHLGIFIGK